MRHAPRRASKVLLITGAVLLLLLTGLLLLSVSCMHCFSPGCENSDRAKLDIQNIAGALKLYREKHGRYPSTSEGLQALVETNILEAPPRDPWGNLYGYALQDSEIELHSWGSDGAPGGSGVAEDIIERFKPLRSPPPDAGS